MQLTLGELRVVIREALEGVPTLPISADQVLASIRVAERGSDREAGGVTAFVAFVPKPQFGYVAGGLGDGSNRDVGSKEASDALVKTSKDVKIRPADVARLAKDNEADVVRIDKKTKKKTPVATLVLKNPDEAHDRFISKMAQRIAQRYSDVNIDYVIPVTSSKPMSRRLADEVSKLLRTEVGNDDVAHVLLRASRKKRGSEVEIDQEAWEAYKQMHADDPDLVAKTWDKTYKTLQTIRNKPDEEPETKGLPPESRQFLYFHTVDEEANVLQGMRVLVIDDNVATGYTFRGLKKALMNIGASDVEFAAGWDFDHPTGNKKKK
jgi:hypothetical protein